MTAMVVGALQAPAWPQVVMIGGRVCGQVSWGSNNKRAEEKFFSMREVGGIVLSRQRGRAEGV